jgi:hypothetical protein
MLGFHHVGSNAPDCQAGKFSPFGSTQTPAANSLSRSPTARRSTPARFLLTPRADSNGVSQVIKAYFNLLQPITGKNAGARGKSKPIQPSQTSRRPCQPWVGRLLANPQQLTGAFNHTPK